MIRGTCERSRVFRRVVSWCLRAGPRTLTGDEPFNLVKVLLLCGLIGCVVGLKFAH